MKNLDKYEREAKLYPAIITALPFILLYTAYAGSQAADLLRIIALLIVGEISVAAVCVFFLMEANRFISKAVVENFYFSEELRFPTTDLLLFSSGVYSEDYKNKIHKKILKDFKIKLLTKKEEKKDMQLARKKINEAVALIREKVKTGRLVLDQNIRYGAARNMIGGSFIGLTMSIINILVLTSSEQHRTATIFSWVLAGIFGTLIIFSKYILVRQGKFYAKRLIHEYLSN